MEGSSVSIYLDNNDGADSIYNIIKTRPETRVMVKEIKDKKDSGELTKNGLGDYLESRGFTNKIINILKEKYRINPRNPKNGSIMSNDEIEFIIETELRKYISHEVWGKFGGRKSSTFKKSRAKHHIKKSSFRKSTFKKSTFKKSRAKSRAKKRH